MRITETERAIIKQKSGDIFGPESAIFLFGSRTDDAKKGGDIDLLVETDDDSDTVRKKINLMTAIQLAIGDRKIDIVVARRNSGDEPPLIVTLARKTGIRL